MATLTEGKYLGDLVRFEEDGRFSRETVTIKSGADLEPGHVLAVYTATGDVGKFAAYQAGGANGLGAAVAVLATRAGAAGADVRAVVFRRHVKLNRNALTFHSSVDDAAKRDTAVAALKALTIIAD